MSSNLLLYPVSDKRKSFPRIADRKVVHTASQGGDLRGHPQHFWLTFCLNTEIPGFLNRLALLRAQGAREEN